jgi:ribosomal protein L33
MARDRDGAKGEDRLKRKKYDKELRRHVAERY